MGPPGVSCRDMLLAGAAAQRASVLIVGPLGACAICRRCCAWASSRSLPGWPAMCWGRAGCEGGLPASCLKDWPRTLKGTHGRKGDGGKHDSGTAGADDVVGGGRGGDVDGGVVDKLTLIAQCVLLAILRVTRFVFLRWQHHNSSSDSESPSGTSYPGRTPRY